MDTLQRDNVRPFTMINTDFLDCETLEANEKILLTILLRYNGHNNDGPPNYYPGLVGLAKKTGLTKKVVQDTIKQLESKGIIHKHARYLAGSKARSANIYTVRDVPSMWQKEQSDGIDLDMADAINEATDLLQYVGYTITDHHEEASPSDVGASKKDDESLSKKIIKKAEKGTRPFAIIYNDFLDFEGLKSKEKLVLLLLMRYGGTHKENFAFPSVTTLANKTGMSERSVQYTLAKLIGKKLIDKYARYDRNGGQTSNVYVVHDDPAIWRTYSENADIETMVSEREIITMKEKLQAHGYTVTKMKDMHKTSDKKKASPSDVGASNEDESLSKKIINSYDNNTSLEQKSQGETQKKQDFTSKNTTKKESESEPYPMQFLHDHYDYTSISMIADQQSLGQENVDAVFSVLYDTLNCQQSYIRIGKESKLTKVVISKLLKLDCEDIIETIISYKAQPETIHSPLAWVRTALYYAKENNHLHVTNELAKYYNN